MKRLFETVGERQHNSGRAVWRERTAYFLSFALLLMASVALPAACRSVTATCTHYTCCLPDEGMAANSAAPSLYCCGVVASQQQMDFVSPDSGQAAVASLIEAAPVRIVHSFYEHQRALCNLSEFNQPILPQLDPLQKTTQLLI